MAVKRIMQTAGPDANVVVVSDHGFCAVPHRGSACSTCCAMPASTPPRSASAPRAPAAHIYVNLAGRESGGTVDAGPPTPPWSIRSPTCLTNAIDPNATFNNTLSNKRVVLQDRSPARSAARRVSAPLHLQQHRDRIPATSFAQLDVGYNFDGIQKSRCRPPGRCAVSTPRRRCSRRPNFYGAPRPRCQHSGDECNLPGGGASFQAATMSSRRWRNIDVAPTIMSILGVTPSPDGRRPRGFNSVLR